MLHLLTSTCFFSASLLHSLARAVVFPGNTRTFGASAGAGPAADTAAADGGRADSGTAILSP